MLSINVQDTPLHVVVWKGQDSSTTEITQLKKRVEELEALVRSLVETKSSSSRIQTVSEILCAPSLSVPLVQESKPTKSPFFKSTSVPEPVGLSVLTSLDLDLHSTTANSVN